MKIQAVLFDLDSTLMHRDQSIVVYARQFLQDFSSNAHYFDEIISSELVGISKFKPEFF